MKLYLDNQIKFIVALFSANKRIYNVANVTVYCLEDAISF